MRSRGGGPDPGPHGGRPAREVDQELGPAPVTAGAGGRGVRGHRAVPGTSACYCTAVKISAANRLIGEVVQSRRRPLLGPSPC